MAERRDEGFLARWARRKQAAREAEREPEPPREVPPAPARAADADAPERPDAAKRPALPDPATLDQSSEFSAFLGKDVPRETHRAALRQLWRLDPIYNRLDGLDDYCEDFTDQAKVVKGLRTAYKVGRGLLERTDEPGPADREPPAKPAGDEAQRVAVTADEPPSQPASSQPAEPKRASGKSRPRRLPKHG